jgi:hypothetical protein
VNQIGKLLWCQSRLKTVRHEGQRRTLTSQHIGMQNFPRLAITTNDRKRFIVFGDDNPAVHMVVDRLEYGLLVFLFDY